MCTEDLGDIALRRAYPDARTGNALPYKPVPAVEGSRPPVQRVAHHVALLNRPSRQDDEPAAEDAAVVELAMGEDVPRLLPYGLVVLLRPALLQPDNVWLWLGRRDLVADFREALVAELRDELEAPAIERQDPQLRGRLAAVWRHGEVAKPRPCHDATARRLQGPP